MPSKYPHPNLSPDGWTSSSLQVADQMLSDFFLSEYSQTATWPDKVKSFPWFIQRYADDLVQLSTQLQETLKTYFGTQFENVDVETTVIANPDSINTQSLTFFLTFSDSTGEVFNLNRIITYSNTKIIEINNILKG